MRTIWISAAVCALTLPATMVLAQADDPVTEEAIEEVVVDLDDAADDLDEVVEDVEEVVEDFEEVVEELEEAEEQAEEAADDTQEAADEAREAADDAQEAADAAEEAAEAAQLPTGPSETPSINDLRQVMDGDSDGDRTTFGEYAADNPATASSGGPGDSSTDQPWHRITESELLEPEETYPRVDFHGYYRFRADSFWNLDLDTGGTSPVLPPIEALIAGDSSGFGNIDPNQFPDFVNEDAEHIGGANMRFRLRPTVHISETLRIHTEMAILDNIVLGSTPDGWNELTGAGRTDLPLVGFSGSQESPTLLNSGRNSVSVTQLYGEVQPFFGTIRLGRMASHWGLGILANGGGSYTHLREPRVSDRNLSVNGHTCLDCDFGDYVDRAMFITNLFDTYVALAWDYNYSGPTDFTLAQPQGQPRDMGQYDDVRSYVLSVFQRPMRPEEIAERNRTLKELRRPTLDWGAYVVIRNQRISPEAFTPGEGITGDAVYSLRGARAYVPDLWLRWQYEPQFRRRIRVELEAVGILGTIDNVRAGTTELDTRNIQQFATALEVDYTNMALSTGLNTGFATGRTPGADAQPGFGVIDQNIPSTDEDTLTAFKFDRNYNIDMIMFREVIGTVTNAIYVNPFFQYDLFAKQDDVLGLRLDLIYGQAMNPDVTPSGEGWLGLETDATLYYRMPRFGADVSFGFFLPGTAFDAVEGRPRLQSSIAVDNNPGAVSGPGYTGCADSNGDICIGATPSFSLQGRFFWIF